MENNYITAADSPMVIPKKLLIYVYFVLPVLLLIVLADMFYLNYKLLPHAGIQGIYLPLYVFLFSLPHIISSFFSFLDREYVSYYKKYLFFYLPGLLIATATLLYVDYLLGIVFFLVNDVWHGIKQKVGIALILGAKADWLHRVWTFLPFITSSLAFVYFIRPEVYPDFFVPFISPTLFIGAILILISMIAMMYKNIPAVRWYIFGVSLLFLLSYFFILSGYIFFAILAFRFVHDISAFAFYVTHDHNRNIDGYKNWFYRFLSTIPLPTLILTPLLGIAFAYFIRTATNGIVIGYTIVILICMSHYYLESVMWKRGSPHRQHVKVV